MDKQIVKLKNQVLGAVIMAFNLIQGPRPIMVAYKIGRVQQAIKVPQEDFVTQIRPFIDAEGNVKEDLTDEAKAVVQEILNEETTFKLPVLTLRELHDAGLQVEDTSVFTFLVDVGIVKE